MKSCISLNCLMPLIPFNARAFPGHNAAVAWAAALFSILLLPILGSPTSEIGLYRRRQTVQADD